LDREQAVEEEVEDRDEEADVATPLLPQAHPDTCVGTEVEGRENTAVVPQHPRRQENTRGEEIGD
jgi:hypothetical protein